MEEEFILREFSGVNEFNPPKLLQSGELTFSENIVLDEHSKRGIAVKRNGFVTVNSNSCGGVVNSLHSYDSSNGGNILFAGGENSLISSANETANWVTVKTGLNAAKLRSTLAGDKLVFSNGVNEMFCLTGENYNQEGNLLISIPDLISAGTKATASMTGGEMGAGYYRYVLVYSTALNDSSSPSSPIEVHSSVNGGLTGTTNSVSLTNLPVSSNPLIVKKLLFRTVKTANYDRFYNFYLRAILDNQTTSFNDGLSDSNDLRLDFNISPGYNRNFKSKYLCVHKERLFASNILSKVKNYFEPAITNDLTGINIFKVSSATDTGTGGKLRPESYYRYRCVFVDENGIESNAVETPEFLTPTAGGEFISTTLQLLPFAGFERNALPNIKRRLYRTEGYPSSGFPGNFKLLIDHTGFTGNIFVDEVPDNLLGAVYNLTTEEEKLESAVCFSQIDKYSTFLAENIIQVFPSFGSYITGIFDDVEGLLVFKNNSICKIYTSGSPSNWKVIKLNESTGCDEPDSIVKRGAFFYFFHNRNLYHFSSGSGITNISINFVKTLTKGLSSILSACYSGKKNWLVIAAGAPHNLKYLIVFDIKTGYFYKLKVKNANCVIESKKTGELLFTNNSDFTVSGTSSEEISTDNESSLPEDISIKIVTKTFTGGSSSSQILRLRKLWFSFNAIKNKSFTLRIVDSENSLNFKELTLVNTGLGDTTIKVITDSLSGSLKYCTGLYIEIFGTGIKAINEIRIKTKLVNRGTN
ncbi:MAG: hypothetical protein IAE91_07810 [Ignavibacteriaceae bacterium]|nr:hypothetical protein [Ignavibacteriaceae bacterium]